MDGAELIWLVTDETTWAQWWNTSTMARADTCPFAQLQPSCCMINTKQLAKSGFQVGWPWKPSLEAWGPVLEPRTPVQAANAELSVAAGVSWSPNASGALRQAGLWCTIAPSEVSLATRKAPSLSRRSRPDFHCRKPYRRPDTRRRSRSFGLALVPITTPGPSVKASILVSIAFDASW